MYESTKVFIIPVDSVIEGMNDSSHNGIRNRKANPIPDIDSIIGADLIEESLIHHILIHVVEDDEVPIDANSR